MSPMLPRTMDPLKTRMSSGSETSGEKLSLARSFQNASLRRGSSPAVENDSICAMRQLPIQSVGIYLFSEKNPNLLCDRAHARRVDSYTRQSILRTKSFGLYVLYADPLNALSRGVFALFHKGFELVVVCRQRVTVRCLRIEALSPSSFQCRTTAIFGAGRGDACEARGSSEIDATQRLHGLCPAPGAERHICRLQPYPARTQPASWPVCRAGADRPESRSEPVERVRRSRYSEGEFRGDDRRSGGARTRQEAQVGSGRAHLLARAHFAGAYPAAACRRAAVAARTACHRAYRLRRARPAAQAA